MRNQETKVELKLPVAAEYVSVARLTASGIANRIGFDIEAIEDIKVALAEVCNKLITCKNNATDYTVIFTIRDKELNISFACDELSVMSVFQQERDEIGMSIIEALMDSFEIGSANTFILSMSKRVEV